MRYVRERRRSPARSLARAKRMAVQWALVVALLITAACGSTVATLPDQIADGQAAPENELSLEGALSTDLPSGAQDGASVPTIATSPTNRPGGSAFPGGAATSNAAPGASRASRTPVPASAESPPGNHHGVTDESIGLGFVYVTGSDEWASGMGLSSGQGDTKRQIEAAVAAVNASGGIAGRQVNLLTYPFRAGENIDTQLQAACEHFTGDNMVFAVSGNLAGVTGGIGDVLYHCLARKQVAYIENFMAGDTEAFAQYPDIAYTPATFRADRAAALNIDALAGIGWFGQNPVIGIHSLDTPLWRRVANEVVKPRLAMHGYSAIHEFYMRMGVTGADGVGEYPAVSLRFKAAGVSHVVSIGTSPVYFSLAAESQGWRPQWGYDTDSSPSNWEGFMQRPQLANAMGTGWSPARDLLPANRGEAVNDAEQRCMAIMEEVGEDTAPPLARQLQLSACTSVFFLEHALARAPEISIAGLAAGARALGHDYQDPATWRSTFADPERAGPSGYRIHGYAQDCSCLRYLSDLRPAS